MTFKALLTDPRMSAELLKSTPASPLTKNPLTLVHGSDGLTAWWNNCMDADWWVGQEDGIFTRQIHVNITDEEIIAAARAAGIDQVEIDHAFLSRPAESEAARAANRASYLAWSATHDAKRIHAADNARADFIAKHPELGDLALAEAALAEMEQLATIHRHAVKMTRKGDLLAADGNKLAHFTNLSGMKAWLYQNGYRASIDDRHHFFAAVQ